MPAGRPKGSRNKGITDLSHCRAKVIEIIHERLYSKNPDEQWDAVKTLAQYMFPRLQSTTLTGESSITLNITATQAERITNLANKK